MKCDPSLLQSLVHQSADPGAEAQPVIEHLEHCQHCRDELAALGGDPQSWCEVSEWLSAWMQLADSESCDTASAQEVDLSFLAPPAHPEMLGRIGRYDVESLLGHGGMGIVLRAHDSDLHRTVAVKVLAPQWAASPTARQRFAREAQAAASVAHENVIPIYNVEATATLPFLVMRYVPGMTLQQWVATHGPPDVGTILRVAGQLAEGLAAAHRRGLVHRDIKPGNVLVGHNIDRVWITDFGLARAADSMTLTRTGVIAGTPHYMSPEQARGEAIDHRSDLFSLGCVLYFLCSGRPPFDAENTLAVLHKIVSQRAFSLTHWRDDLPPSLVRLVQQLLQRSTERRPQDCQAVSEKIAEAQCEHQHGRRSRRRSIAGWRVALATVAVFTVATSATWGLMNWINQPAAVPRLRVWRNATPNHTSKNMGSFESMEHASSTFDFVATQIVASLDDPPTRQRIARLEADLAQAAENPDSVVFDPLKWKHSNWETPFQSVRNELVGLQAEVDNEMLQGFEDDRIWRKQIQNLETAIRQASDPRD
ncbi:serine/threonine-protein kinase [Roseimaritima ulvae]|uniref:non-specific serine/threonine protein kinase n=1 Tax=Roseimaritima ulvae TaxID=980254 RepID=A0A5B9QRG7_9BACT|nr:serine/threonine-protein kinase [Roseimaritima ulvae]QEG41697.1 Serine/threonine-protein kinase PrkC [Roseimaritima ulvae]